MRPENTKQALQGSRANPVWVLGLAIGVLLLLFCLVSDDTATAHYLGSFFLSGDWHFRGILLGIAAVSLGIQLALLRLRRFWWIAWLPLCLYALGLLYSETLWVKGGWDRFGSSMIWVAAFPAYFGAALATVLVPLLRQKKAVKLTVLALVLAVSAIAAIWFWPRPLDSKLTLSPSPQVLYYDTDGALEPMLVTDSERLYEYLRWAKVSPCYAAPDWDAQRGLLLRLDSQHILVAPDYGTPYIYQYDGPLEAFDGEALRWAVPGYSDLYNNLRTVSSPTGK